MRITFSLLEKLATRLLGRKHELVGKFSKWTLELMTCIERTIKDQWKETFPTAVR